MTIPIATENQMLEAVLRLTISALCLSTNSPFSIIPDTREPILVTIHAVILEVEDGSNIDDKCVKIIKDHTTSE